MSKKPVHVEVVAKKGESGDRLIKRFLKKMKKERLMEEFFKHSFYEKPSTKRRRQAKARAEVLRKLRLEREGKSAKRSNYKKKKRRKG